MNISNSTAQALSAPGPASTLPAVQLLSVRAVTQSSESPSATFTLPSPSSITVDGGRVLRQLASSHAQPSASSNAFGASVTSTRRGEGGGRRRLLNIRARRDAAGSTSAAGPEISTAAAGLISSRGTESSTAAAGLISSRGTESSTTAVGLISSTGTESSTTAEGSASTVTSTSSAGSASTVTSTSSAGSTSTATSTSSAGPTSAPSSTSTSSPVNVGEIVGGVLGSLGLALGLGFGARSLMGCVKRNRDVPRQAVLESGLNFEEADRMQVAMGGLSSAAKEIYNNADALLLAEAMRESINDDAVSLEELTVFLLNRQDNGENVSHLLKALLEKDESETEV